MKHFYDSLPKIFFYLTFGFMGILLLYTLTGSYSKITDTSRIIHEIDNLTLRTDTLFLKNKLVESLNNKQSESTQAFLFTVFSIVLISIGLFVLSNIQTKYDKLDIKYNENLNELSCKIQPEIISKVQPEIIDKVTPVIIKELIENIKPSLKNNNNLITISSLVSETYQNYNYYLNCNDFSKLRDSFHYLKEFINQNDKYFEYLAKTIHKELIESYYNRIHNIYNSIKEEEKLLLKGDYEIILNFLKNILDEI